MDEFNVRKKGILLNCSRIDRISTREVWIYKGRKIDIAVYDPSAVEVVRLLSVTAESKTTDYVKFDAVLKEIYEAYRTNREFRDIGNNRKTELKLTNEKKVLEYMSKCNKLQRKAIKRKAIKKRR